MARYIDATPIEEKLKEAINIGKRNDDEGYYELIPVLEDIQGTPTADVVERKHGRWLPYEFGNERWHKCSACGIADEYINEKGLEAIRGFCPNCGAVMDERRDDVEETD